MLHLCPGNHTHLSWVRIQKYCNSNGNHSLFVHILMGEELWLQHFPLLKGRCSGIPNLFFETKITIKLKTMEGNSAFDPLLPPKEVVK